MKVDREFRQRCGRHGGALVTPLLGERGGARWVMMKTARDIKRSISSSPHSLSSSLEMCRHKLWMYLTLSDVDICKV